MYTAICLSGPLLLSDKLDPSTLLMCPVGDGGVFVCGRDTERGEREAEWFQDCLRNHFNTPKEDLAVITQLRGFGLYVSTIIE